MNSLHDLSRFKFKDISNCINITSSNNYKSNNSSNKCGSTILKRVKGYKFSKYNGEKDLN